MKKLASLLLAGAMMLSGSALAFEATDEITVISREASSGTRGAFDEMMNIVVETDEGTEDMLYPEAVLVDSTDAVTSKVEVDAQAIGYTSLGAVTDSVKALPVDGVEATVENVKNGSYALARPFVLATQTGVEDELAADFIKYVMSTQGQAIVAERGYVTATDDTATTADGSEAVAATEYTSSGLTGKITLSGSTSVEKVIEALKEGYVALNPDVTIEITYSGSSAGIKDVTEGKVNIGMSSRALKEDELATLTQTTFAHDGIAVIVNAENPITSITSAQITAIYTGQVRTWDAVETVTDDATEETAA